LKYARAAVTILIQYDARWRRRGVATLRPARHRQSECARRSISIVVCRFKFAPVQICDE